MNEYKESVKNLIPTEDQTKAFVEYVAKAHSWYKHLSKDRVHKLYVFLNPTVMMSRDITKKDPPQEVFKGDKILFHYSSMPTQDYRRMYGYWDYSMDEKPYPRGVDGRKLKVPTDLVCYTTVSRAFYGKTEPDPLPSEYSWREVIRKDNEERLRQHQDIFNTCNLFLKWLGRK